MRGGDTMTCLADWHAAVRELRLLRSSIRLWRAPGPRGVFVQTIYEQDVTTAWLPLLRHPSSRNQPTTALQQHAWHAAPATPKQEPACWVQSAGHNAIHVDFVLT